MSGIYIHVPFCKRRCGYCNFYSSTLFNLKDDYLDAIKKEIVLRCNYLDTEVKTIYFGGGTPSLLSVNEIQNIITLLKDCFTIADNAEITIEANPDDLTTNYIENLAKSNVNRLSIGIQSFNNNMLTFMNRRHNSQQAIDAITYSQKNGFNNISIDLIYGLPNMTLNEWQKQLDIVENLNVQHLSAYHLTYEEGTAFGKKLEQHQLEEIPEEESLAQFDILTNWAKKIGFEHYEISNFAKENFRSKHNSNYWNGTPYLGIGPAAHSFNITTRSWNCANVKEYIENIRKGKNINEIETLTTADKFNDYVITSLRTIEGINLNYLHNNFPSTMTTYLEKQASCFITNNKLKIEQNHLKLTHDGIFISDKIMQELIYIE